MKQGEGKDVAREMYVHQQMTFDEIAKRIGRSDKTVRDWAAEGNWKVERQSFIKTKTSVHEKLYTLVEKLTDIMIRDCDETSQLPSFSQITAVKNLAESLTKLYSYDDKVKVSAEADKPKEQDGLSDETLAKIEKQLNLL